MLFIQNSYWSLVINPGAKCYEHLDEILSELVKDNPNCKYAYCKHYVQEVEESFNVNHIHLALYLGRKPKRFETIQNLFNGAHIEFTNRNRFNRCIQYLIHKNNTEKFQYSINDIVSNYSDVELSNIIDSNGYEFELFEAYLLQDYIIDCFVACGTEENITKYMFYFINRFGIDTIKPYYNIIKDLLHNYEV